MPKTLATLSVALFALLFAGAALAAPTDQAVPEAPPATVEAVEAEPAPAASVQATEALLCQAGPPDPPPDFEECGDVVCPPPFFCCNPLRNLCVREGQACIQ